MQQLLWHWTGLNNLDNSNRFHAIHIGLTVTDDAVRAVFFRSLNERETEFAGAPGTVEELETLINSNSNIPASRLGPTALNWGGEYLGPAFANTRITPLGVATLTRTGQFLGSAEGDGPALYAFPLNQDGLPFAPFNIYSQSLITKRASRFTRFQTLDMWPVMVAVPHSNAPFTEAHFLVRNQADHAFVSNLSGWTASENLPVNDFASSLPTLTLTQHQLTMAANSSATIDVQVRDKEGLVYTAGTQDIYLEETGGFLPLRRVKSSAGLASFRVSTIGMEAGEVFKVKAGFRNFSGCDEVVVTVV